MKIIIGSDKKGWALKNLIKEYLKTNNIIVEDVSIEGDNNFVEASKKVVAGVLENVDENKGIIIDEYGVGPFMVAAKHKYIICAELNDEHSAKMTRDHNNANVITIGSGIVGDAVAKQICYRFATAAYAAGRHQIRVDMLNKMC